MLFKASHDNDSELRRMSRAELVDIIYALKVSETNLQQEKEDLQTQLKNHKDKAAENATLDSLAKQMGEVVRETRAAAREAHIAAAECLNAAKEVRSFDVADMIRKLNAEGVLPEIKLSAPERSNPALAKIVAPETEEATPKPTEEQPSEVLQAQLEARGKHSGLSAQDSRNAKTAPVPKFLGAYMANKNSSELTVDDKPKASRADVQPKPSRSELASKVPPIFNGESDPYPFQRKDAKGGDGK